MNRRPSSLTPIKDILADLWRGGRLPFNPEDGEIWQVWEEVVGDRIARQAHPIWIKDGRLRVSVRDPMWLQELQFGMETIRRRLNARLNRPAVKKIEFRLNRK